jgi:hypothetical protein
MVLAEEHERYMDKGSGWQDWARKIRQAEADVTRAGSGGIDTCSTKLALRGPKLTCDSQAEATLGAL